MSVSFWATKLAPQRADGKNPLKELTSLLKAPFAGSRRRSMYLLELAVIRSLRAIGLARLLIGHYYSVQEDRTDVTNFTYLRPAETIDFGDPAHDSFLRSCQDIVGGRFEHASIFVCEVPSAKFLPENGLVFDRKFRTIADSILDYRRLYSFLKTFRPRHCEKRIGTFSSVQHPWHYNNWHWMADSMPQVCSLAKYMQGRPLTLLMSSDLGRTHRQALESILPPNFSIEYVNPRQWFDLETFVLPSFVSDRGNAFFPPEYYEFIRENTFSKLAVSRPKQPNRRYYISRSRAKHRRVLNEQEIVTLLDQFGFENILIEDYNFKQQVELFRSAEAIVSPHGAALGSIMYADDLKVCVLYPEARPAGYFYTLARGLGHRHFHTNDDRQEDDDFHVDPDALLRVLTEEMQLQPVLNEVHQLVSETR